MSVLVRPPKRKLDEIQHLEEQNGYIPHVSKKGFGQQETDTGSQTQSETSGDPQWLASTANSNRASPIRFDSPFQAQRKFSPHASIVLVGIRGTGKSSLAVMLASTSGKRLIDADRYFQQVTGRSRAVFKKEYGIAEYRQQEARVMESMLIDHKEGFVIACGPGSMERSGQRLLRQYATTHPVVHIIRDPESIQSYLKAWDTDKICRFLELSGPIYRACSNLEFFNVSEKCAGEYTSHSQLELELDQRSQSSTPFLTLKRLQRDFLRFIALATGGATDMSTQHASFPLSMIPVESRTYTYAVTVPISSLFEQDMDIEDLESTADAFELKVDVAKCPPTDPGVDSSFADKISHTVATIRRSIVVPFIYHVESNISLGARRPDDEYLNLVQHGLRLSPGFVTVDLAYDDTILSQIIASRGSSKVIGHFAAPKPLPGGWDGPEYMALYERSRKLGCDIVRLSQPATTIEDNFAIQRFHHQVKTLPEPHLPLIAYNSGPLGRLSCCFNPILTPVIHPSFSSETKAKYLPCITIREAQEGLYASFTLDPMHFFVFGANVNYSLSPTMHNAAYNLIGMPHVYRIHQSPTLRGLNDLVDNPHFGGTSVSLPYKTEVIPLLHSMSPHARAIGAVNTLIPISNNTHNPDQTEKDNTIVNSILASQHSSLYLEKSRAGPITALHGDNTDWIGICNCFRRGLSPANAIRPSSTGLVIGAGGMARAAVYAMIHLGVQNIFVYNRTFANAEKLAEHYNRQKNVLLLPSTARGRPTTTVHTLRSLGDPWPAGFKQPTVVTSCIPAHSISGQPPPCFEIPSQWLESPTGGVVVEVCQQSPLPSLLLLFKNRAQY